MRFNHLKSGLLSRVRYISRDDASLQVRGDAESTFSMRWPAGCIAGCLGIALVNLCAELFQAWEMWLSPHSEKPVGSEVGGQDPRPWISSPVGNQACIVPRLLWDLLLLNLPHPEASKCLLSIFIFLKSGLDLPGMEPSRFDHFSLYFANILLWCIQWHPLLCLQKITTPNKPLHSKGGPSLM